MCKSVRPATHLVLFIGECDVYDRDNKLICRVSPDAHAQRVIQMANHVANALGAKQLALAPMHPRCHNSGYQHDDPYITFARDYNRSLRNHLKAGVGRVIVLKTTKSVPEDNTVRRFIPRPEMYDQNDFDRFGFGINFLPGTQVHYQVFQRSIHETWPTLYD